MHSPSPALVTAHAARRLPRWVPWVLIAAYVLPGFLGRDPWRTDDLAAFAVMIDMRDGGPWWQPQVLGEAAQTLAWLPYWLGALAMRWLPLPAELAARIPFALLLTATLASTWYGTYRLARQPAAQPLTLAFGGEAQPADYARALADGALLALVATLGLAMLTHEAAPAAAQLAFATLLGHGVVLGLVSSTSLSAPRSVAAAQGLWWVGAWGLALSGAPVLMLAIAAAGLTWGGRTGAIQRHPVATAAAVVGAGAAATTALWLAAANPGGEALWTPRWVSWTQPQTWSGLGRLLAWFLWPAALFALWTLWRWRGRWLEPHIGWPATMVGIVVVATLANNGDDRTLLLALPALATLAAFALPTLRRSVTALIDWFAVLFFTGAAAIIWIIWIAMQTGVPSKPAANVARLVPGFEATLDWRLWLPAAVATAVWFGLVGWRLGRHKPALWKGLVLSASGITLNWLLLMTLWLPLLNYGMGQAPISQRIAALQPDTPCVVVHGLNAAQIAGLQHHGPLTVRRPGQAGTDRCRLLVSAPGAYPTLPNAVKLSEWQLRTEMPRLRENREKWLVFERR